MEHILKTTFSNLNEVEIITILLLFGVLLGMGVYHIYRLWNDSDNESKL